MRRPIGWVIAAALMGSVALCAGWWAQPRPSPADEPRARPAARPRPGAAPSPRPQTGWRDVRCEVAHAREGDEVVAAAVGNREATQTALVEDGAFVLVLPPGALTMLFDVPGLETVHAQIDERGTCTITNRPRPQVALTVSVRLPSGEPPPQARLEGCGHRAVRWVPSEPVLRVTAPEPCELVAWSSGEPMLQVSEPAPVDPAAGDQHVELAMPWQEPWGLQLQVRKRGEAFEVVQLGSQAAELLEVGDSVLEIEGVPTADMTMADFVRLDAGPPETSVMLLVRDAEGALREVHVPRER
jgi:hypothetical protein